MGSLGKTLSLASKAFAILFVVVAFILNGVFGWGYEPGSIIAVGGFIAGAFLPVDVSKVVSNAKGA